MLKIIGTCSLIIIQLSDSLWQGCGWRNGSERADVIEIGSNWGNILILTLKHV